MRRAPRCDMSIGELLVHMGACTDVDVQRAREKQFRLAEDGESVQLGALLVRAGVVTAKQIDAALERQREIRKDPTKALRVLIGLGRDYNARLERKLALG